MFSFHLFFGHFQSRQTLPVCCCALLLWLKVVFSCNKIIATFFYFIIVFLWFHTYLSSWVNLITLRKTQIQQADWFLRSISAKPTYQALALMCGCLLWVSWQRVSEQHHDSATDQGCSLSQDTTSFPANYFLHCHLWHSQGHNRPNSPQPELTTTHNVRLRV